MKVSLVSHSDISGGAAIASHRLLNALDKNDGIETVNMIVSRKFSLDDKVLDSSRFSHGINILANGFSQIVKRFTIGKGGDVHSLSLLGDSSVFNKIASSDSDIVNLHWVNAECLSIKQVGSISKPLVITIHDMWLFSGAEHYCEDSSNSKFKSGYQRKSGIKFDLNYYIWKLKEKYWNSDFVIVTPSQWLTNCVVESKLFNKSSVYTIPNCLDTNFFKPEDKTLCREILGLPIDKKIIGFGAVGGTDNPRKGFDLLLNAFEHFSDEDKSKYICVVFGGSGECRLQNTGIEVKSLGVINTQQGIKDFYNAIDVMVVPSRQEAFGQTASEAHACGVPVVAFNATGLVDVVSHKETGYLAQAFDSLDLRNGIEWCLTNNKKFELSERARKKALSNWSYHVVSNKYAKLYKDIIG